MKQWIKTLKVVLCVVGLLVSPQLSSAGASKLTFSGVVLDHGANPVLEHFTIWLSEHANYSLKPTYMGSYQDISNYLQEHRACLAWTCGVPFVQDHQQDGQQLLVVPLFRGEPTYHSLVVRRAGRNEAKLLDFKGEVFAYSDIRSNSGYVAPAYTLKTHGIDINDFFRLLIHTGSHEYAIDAVLNGLADIANIDEYIYVEYLKKHPQAKSKLQVVEKFGPFPFPPLVAGKDATPAVIKRLQEALIHMHEDKEGAAILTELGLDGFVVKSADFYQPLKVMLEALEK